MKLPWWAKALMLAALLALATWAVRTYNESLREEGRAEVRAQVAERASEEAATNAKETQRRLTRQKENDDVASANLSRLAADGARLRDAGVGLRQRVNELEQLARGGACGDTAPESQRQAAQAATGMLAELQRRADERAGILADYADRARIAGQQCEADYQSLTDNRMSPPAGAGPASPGSP